MLGDKAKEIIYRDVTGSDLERVKAVLDYSTPEQFVELVTYAMISAFNNGTVIQIVGALKAQGVAEYEQWDLVFHMASNWPVEESI